MKRPFVHYRPVTASDDLVCEIAGCLQPPRWVRVYRVGDMLTPRLCPLCAEHAEV